MQHQSTGRVVFKFHRPSKMSGQEPSPAMTEALQRLSEADEMKGLIAMAGAQGRKLVIEVFHAAAGYPLLIHACVVPRNDGLADR